MQHALNKANLITYISVFRNCWW